MCICFYLMWGHRQKENDQLQVKNEMTSFWLLFTAPAYLTLEHTPFRQPDGPNTMNLFYYYYYYFFNGAVFLT